ncbi:EAL domain-containing protein [uncultured Pseudoteredinibacter sp.]|uniref:putative bifunctional diguanylate cyclase/phosphodiesterase n=1 Tax=uncultured Pseudoteredinibacter sp. TaxID=1641701 RepID=UPI00261F9932|nr:EAL domain-containing protein [uncultured Pseudoteredinibacter sp.]
MKNWTTQKNNIQIIVATAFILLIAGGVWGMIDHQQGFMRQLIQDRLRDYNLAFWESVAQDADDLFQITQEQKAAFINKDPKLIRHQLAETFPALNSTKKVHHLAFYGKDTKLQGLQNQQGLQLDRHSLQLLNLPGAPSEWHIELSTRGEMLLCVLDEIKVDGTVHGYLEVAKPASEKMLGLARQYNIFSLIAASKTRPIIGDTDASIDFSDLNKGDFAVIHNDFKELSLIELQEEQGWLANIKQIRFHYQGREYQGSLRKVFDSKQRLAMIHMAAIDITEMMAAHKRKLAIFIGLALFSFTLLSYVVIRYLRAVERDLNSTYASLANEVEDHKKTESQLIEAKQGLEYRITERTTELRRLNEKLRDDLKTRHSMQQALMVSERQYRTLFDHSSDAMILLEDGNPSLCNTAAVELIKLESHNQIKEVDLYDLLAEDTDKNNGFRSQFIRTLGSSIYGQPLKHEWRCKDFEGREFFADITLSKIPSEDHRRLAHLTIRDITEKKEAELKISSQAYYDSLTSLPNRNLFMDRLHQAVAFADRNQCYGAVLFMDLDNFKYINDSLGHAVGDAVLIEVAKRLNASARSQDTIARFGGDEFVMLIPANFANKRMATINTQKIAEKIRRTFSPPINHQSHEFHLTPSIGVTLFNSNETAVADILKHADTAMYQAKSLGKNSICFFELEMQRSIDQRLRLESKMREAIKRNAFELRFQPKIGQQGDIIGAESLCRWQLPEGDWVSPVEFIPIAEETGLITELGNWVFEMAIATLAEIQQQHLSKFTMSINVSPLQINQSNIVRQLLHTCTHHQVKPCDVTLEITESVLMQDAKSTEEKLRRLKSHGFQISIDDFGTGYSSLAYLKHLSINELKIDRSFVSDIGQDPDDDAIVETILAMSRHLKLSVVAEGVENEEQLRFLQRHSCEQYQGFYFSKPLKEAELMEFISNKQQHSASEISI